MQEQQLSRMIELKNVAGLLMLCELSTKKLCVERIDTYSDMIGYDFAEGRASSTSKLDSLSGHRAARRKCLDPKLQGSR